MRYFLRCLVVGAFCFLCLVSAQFAGAATTRGDWTMLGNGPAHQRVNPSETILSKTTVAHLTRDWTVSTGGAIESLDTIVSNNIAYFTSEDGYLYAVNATTGAVLWKKFLVSQAGLDPSSPTIANGVLYLCSSVSIDGNMHALNARTGAVLWTNSSVNCSGGSSATVVQNALFIGGKNDLLYALNATTGKVLWSRALDTIPEPMSGAPAVVNGMVYDVAVDGTVYALNALTGATLWTGKVGSCPTGKTCTLSSPVVVNGILYVGGSDGKMYAFHLVTRSR